MKIIQEDLHSTWQTYYDCAVGEGGKVVKMYGNMDRIGCLTLNVVVEKDGKKVEYSPYFNQSPFDGEENDEDYLSPGREFETDSDAWLVSMTNATDWETWDWGDPVELD